jgi:flagellar motility protein MotE (MotC chaperone)
MPGLYPADREEHRQLAARLDETAFHVRRALDEYHAVVREADAFRRRIAMRELAKLSSLVGSLSPDAPASQIAFVHAWNAATLTEETVTLNIAAFADLPQSW